VLKKNFYRKDLRQTLSNCINLKNLSMHKNRLASLLLCFIGFYNISIGQTNLEKTTLNGMYVGTMADILDSIGKDANIVFSYDRKLLESYRTMVRPMRQSVSLVLADMLKEHKMKFYQDADGIVYIAEKDKNFEFHETTEVQERKGPSKNPVKYNYTLSGIIKDKASGEAVPFAIIGILGSPVKTNTNVDGYFTFLKVPNDTSVLLITSVGYKTSRFFLNPDLPQKNLNIELRPDIVSLEEVVVKSEKQNLNLSSTEEIGLIKISPKKMAELPHIGEKDIMRSFQLMPGISASNESSAGLYVRGGTPDQNLILFDGFTVYYVDHLYGFYSAFNPNAVKDINLFKGGFESKYGGRLSSVCEITGKDGNQKNISVGGDVSLLCTNIFVEVPYKDKFSSIIAFRRSYQGYMYDKLFSKFNKTTNRAKDMPQQKNRFGTSSESTVSSYFYDLNGKFTYKPNNKDILTLSFYNGADNLDNSNEPGMAMGPGGGGGGITGFNMEKNDITDFGNTGSSLKWSRKWTNRLYNNTLVSFSNYYSNRDMTRQSTIETDTSTKTIKEGTLEENDVKDYSLKSNFELQVTDNHMIEFGIHSSQQRVKYSFGQNDTSTILDRDNTGVLQTGYIQDNMKFFSEKLSIIPGLRSTWYDKTKKFYTEPRFSASYKITHKIKFGASIGKYYQFISRVVREDISSGSRDFWILADEERIPVSSAIHYITSLAYEDNDYLYSVEAYYKTLKGVTEYTLRIVPMRMKMNYEENFYNGVGYSRGIEFLAQKKTGDINGWVSYTLGESRSQFDVYGKNYFPSLQDIRHEFKIVGVYRMKQWCFSSNWIFASGKPYTQPSGSYNLTMLDGNTLTLMSVEAKNASRMPAYHRLDLSVTYDFPMFDKAADGSINFSIFNAYNRSNIWYKEYLNYEGVAIENNTYFLGITPNLSFTLKF
jgi:ferric enterobactin receptor